MYCIRRCAGLVLLLTGFTVSGHAQAARDTATYAFSSDTSTVLLLHFDGNLEDSGWNQLAVTVRGGPPEWMRGRFGQAMSFNGQTVVQIANASTLYVGNHSWTVEAWIKPERSQHTYATVFGGGWGFGRIYGLRIDNGRNLEAFFNDGTADPGASGSVISGDISRTVFDGNWHQVAMVLDRARYGEVRLYLDGKRIETPKPVFCGPMLLEDGAMGFAVGSLVPWDVSFGYSGLIDEVRVSDIVRPEYLASSPILSAEIPAPRRAKISFQYNPSTSETPLALAPERTMIVPHSVIGEGNTNQAAKLLQKYLRAIYQDTTGFEIVDQDHVSSQDGKVILALGDSKWADDATLARIPQFGYRITRKANVVVIAGSNSTGTLAGAVHFLDQFAGVRFYMPGDAWTSVPVGKRITLGDIDETISPFVAGSVMTGLEQVPGIDEWAAYNDVTRRIGGSDQHNMFALFPPSRYAEKFPEVYPTLNGQRHVPQTASDQGWQPDFSSPQTLEAAKESVRRYFTEHPEYSFVAFGIMDGSQFDESPTSMAIVEAFERKYADPGIAKAHAYSQMYWDFINKLGEWMQTAAPGKLLMAQAYGLVRIPPTFRLSPNVLVVTVWGIAELDADRRLVPGANGVSELQSWLSVASHVGNQDWMQGSGYYIPRSYTRYYSSYLRALKAAGLQNSFQHIEAYPNWGLDGPKYYIVSRLMWDPELDVDSLWKQFCDDMFGPASAPMQHYFRTIESLWVQLDDVEGPERKLFLWSTQFKTTAASAAMLREARADLDQANTLAITPEERQRVDLFSRTFHLSELLLHLAAENNVSQHDIADIRMYFSREIAPDPMTFYSQMRQMKTLDAAISGAAGSRIVRK